MQRHSRLSSFINFFLFSPGLAFTLIIRFSKWFRELAAKVFQAPPNEENRCRRIKASGKLRISGLFYWAGGFEWLSSDQLKRPNHYRIRKPRRQ
jgi:hypothetical protein